MERPSRSPRCWSSSESGEEASTGSRSLQREGSDCRGSGLVAFPSREGAVRVRRGVGQGARADCSATRGRHKGAKPEPEGRSAPPSGSHSLLSLLPGRRDFESSRGSGDLAHQPRRDTSRLRLLCYRAARVNNFGSRSALQPGRSNIQGVMARASVVHVDPDILSGTRVFVGTRVPFRALIDSVVRGARASVSWRRSTVRSALKGRWNESS